MISCTGFKVTTITTALGVLTSYFFPGQGEWEASLVDGNPEILFNATDKALVVSNKVLNNLWDKSQWEYFKFKIGWGVPAARDYVVAKLTTPVQVVWSATETIFNDNTPKIVKLADNLGNAAGKLGDVVEDLPEVVQKIEKMTEVTANTLYFVAVPLIIVSAISIGYWIASKSGLIKRVRSEASHAYNQHAAPRVKRLFDDHDRRLEEVVPVRRDELQNLLALAKNGPQSQRQPIVKPKEDRRMFSSQQIDPAALKRIIEGA